VLLILSIIALTQAAFSSYTLDNARAAASSAPKITLEPQSEKSEAKLIGFLTKTAELKAKNAEVNNKNTPSGNLNVPNAMLFLNYHVNDQCEDEPIWGIGGYPLYTCYNFRTTPQGFQSTIFYTDSWYDENNVEWLALYQYAFFGRDCQGQYSSGSGFFPTNVCLDHTFSLNVIYWYEMMWPRDSLVATSFFFDGHTCVDSNNGYWQSAPLIGWEDAGNCTKVQHSPKVFQSHHCAPGAFHDYTYYTGKSCLQEPVYQYATSLDRCSFGQNPFVGYFSWLDEFFGTDVYTNQACVAGY
jgi:hypothetical protein